MATARAAADPFDRARELVTPGLRAAADRMNSATRQVIGYHFGWWDEQGRALAGNNGKAVRPALAVLAAEAVGGTADRATNAGVAVELAHNYSLLHDDVMDSDRTRRHRPTAWTVYGVPAAILAGDALITLATEALVADGPPLCTQGVARLDAALLRLVDGQAADTAFEGRTDVRLDECVTMAGDKTSALFAVACELGALAAGAAPQRVWQLRQFGEHLGLAFQLVDDLLGIWGDPAGTGKPVRSDLRARKKSLPVVAALNAGNGAAGRLAELYHRAAPLDDADLRTCANLIEETGARVWAHEETHRHLDAALACLQAANPESRAAAELAAIARRLSTPPAQHAPTDSKPRSFQLPEIRMTRPARLNPQLETARTRALAWAGEMGMLAPAAGVAPWTEAQLAADDYGLLCSSALPDAPADKIDVLTDWFVWAFYVDDYFVDAFKRSGDSAAAQGYAARLPQFMPLDPSQEMPAATNPTERALASLWPRIAPAMSYGWRRRFRQYVEDWLNGHRLELRHINEHYIADPIEYMEMKRRINGPTFFARVAEYAQPAELPEAVADCRTIRSLIDAFADSGILINDIFSYQREVDDEGENSNMVLVLQKSLGCDLQQAVDATNDLLTARLRQLECIADTEIPEMCEVYGLSPAERVNVLGYTNSLQDWLPGWLEWHKRAERYLGEGTAAVTHSIARRLSGPNGFGTATARRLLAGTRT
jgi:geranylgeranyl diphosphate synthase type I